MTVPFSNNKTYLAPRYYRNFITWIFGHLLQNKKNFLLGYFFIFLGTGASVLIPLILQYFFDVAIFSDINTIIITGLIFIGLYTFNFLSGLLGGWINAIFSENIIRNVQVEFFESIHSKSMSFHDSARTGELLSMATNDSRQLSWMLISILMFSLATVTTLSVMGIMFFLEVRLFLIFILFIPLLMIAIIYYGRNMAPVSIRRQKLFGLWQATLQENLTGIRALRTLSNRDREFQKYTNDLKLVREILIKRGIIGARYYPTLIIYIAMGVLFVAGGYYVYLGEITPGTLIAFNSLVLLLLGPNDFIRFTIFLGSMGFAGGKRIFDVVSEQQQLEDGTTHVEKRLQGKIKFENVFFRYNPEGPDILKEVSFTITPGQTIAIIGHTGCGKTTLQKLIQRLYDTTQGTILIDDVDVKSYPIDELRKQIGVIEQDVF